MYNTKDHIFQIASRIVISSIILILVLTFPVISHAQPSLTVSLDRTEATLLDTVQMIVKVSGVRQTDSRPSFKGLESFDIRQGGTSSRVEIINGKMNSGVEYSYNLLPKKTGTFQIGPAELEQDGKIIRSNVETLTIKDVKHVSGDDRGPLFLSAGLSSGEIYVEEQAIYSLKLYMQTNVSDISLGLPEAENLTLRQLGKESVYQSEYNGQQYKVLEVRYALIASKAGVYGVRPARMSMTVIQQSRSRSPFDQFFSRSSGVSKTLASEPLELTVLPLPEQGRPLDFSGLVGTFEIDSRLEPAEIKAGESTTLTVELKGRGNVKQIPDLKIPESEQAKVYADQPVLNEFIDLMGLAGTKIMKWAIVPEKEGTYDIPPLSISFFDTASRQYKSIQTSAYSLSVKPGLAEDIQILQLSKDENGSGASLKKEVKQLGQDILPIHSSLKSLRRSASTGTGRNLIWWFVLAVPILIYAVLFWGIKLNRITPDSLAAQKAKKAAKALIGQCKSREVSYNDLGSALKNYLNDRFNLSIGTLTADEAANILITKGVKPGTSEKLKDLIKEMEDAVYTGKGDNACSLADEIPEHINRIEKEIR